jgi:hypothetical protein
MKLLIIQFSSSSCNFLPLRTEYAPQHPVLTHPQSVFSPLREGGGGGKPHREVSSEASVLEAYSAELSTQTHHPTAYFLLISQPG